MTIGDILAIIAAVVAICTSAWVLTVTCGLLFPSRAEAAREVLLAKTRASIGIGAALTLIPGFLGIAMLGAALPGLKLVGMLIILAILACGAVGAAGLAFVAGDRIHEMAPEMSDYAVFARGAAFLVVGTVFPVLGWFGFAPLALFASVGSGAKSLVARRHSRVSTLGQAG